MSYRPKSVKEIYADSISINLASLRRGMLEHRISEHEVTNVLSMISDLYYEKLEEIEKVCNADSMALETVPSPLELLVECMSKVKGAAKVSPESVRFLGKYASAWESWM